MYTFCLNYRTKGLHLFPSFWGKSCASQYSIFFFFFRLAHLLLNFLVKRCAPFGQNIKQKVYTLWSKKCTPFASIFYRKVYTFCPIRLSFTSSFEDNNINRYHSQFIREGLKMKVKQKIKEETFQTQEASFGFNDINDGVSFNLIL